MRFQIYNLFHKTTNYTELTNLRYYAGIKNLRGFFPSFLYISCKMIALIELVFTKIA